MKNSASFLSLNLLLTTIVLIKIPANLCQKNTESWFSNCTNLFKCGDIAAVGYPFWGGSRPAACGRPGLRLTCKDKFPVIDIMSVKYRVLEINPSSQIIKIIRKDFSKDDICPDEFVNSTVDFSLFEYTYGYVNITAQYGCPPLSIEVPERLKCKVKGTVYRNGYVVPGDQGRGLCRESVFFPIQSSSFGGELRIPDIRELVSSGFELRLKEDGGRCKQCRDSGGSCGFDSQMNQFSCSCPSGQVSESNSCRSAFVSPALIHPGESFVKFFR